METRANYFLVGVFVLLLTAGFLLFALWLGRAQFQTDVKRYNVYFVGAVTGLKKGSFVSYRGITVGEIVKIEIDPKNFEEVLVTIEVQAATPIRKDTVASLEIQGIAGVPFILLQGGTMNAPPLETKEGARYPVITSMPSRLERVLADAPMTVERINLLLARANELLAPENRLAVSNTLKNFSTLSDSLAGQSDQIAHAVGDFSGTMANLREASASLDRLATTLEEKSGGLAAHADQAFDSIGRTAADVDRELTPLLSDLRQTTKSMTAMADQISGLVAENRGPIHSFSGTGLSDLNALLAETRELVANLNRVTTEIERDPARFLFGNQQQGYDANKK